MNRETREIITPIGNQKIAINSFILGGEKSDIVHATLQEAQDLTIKYVVVSIDGSLEDITKKVKEMHGKDYDFIFNEIVKVMEDSTWTAKKKD